MFATQGIWTKGIDGSDINTCDAGALKTKDGYRLLATGDDFDNVRLFRYPSVAENSGSVLLKGHCSHVTRVKFGTHEDGKGQNLYSVGGNDSTVIQWALKM